MTEQKAAYLSPDRKALLSKYPSVESLNSVESFSSSDSAKPYVGAEPKWWRTSAADAPGFRVYRDARVSKKRVCLGVIAGVVTLVVVVVVGGMVHTKYFGPERWESEGWFPSPKGGTSRNWEDSYKKAQKLVEKMSLVEKVNVTTGVGWAQGFCVGNTGPALDVGFPSLCLQDGPLGLRFADHATAWPAGLTTGATWNRDLMRKRGALHALEARLKGVNVILGPAMGPLGRMPAGGRNWEGFGRYLQGVAAAETIKGIQSEGVIATAKHFIFNEQEHFRQSLEWGLPYAISSNVDDRTLHELYLWPFADSVKAGVGSIMCSYQMSNNTYTCGNSKLLNGILKDELGFQGFVQSDWLAQRSGVDSVLAGLDMTMPGDGVIWANGKSLMGPTLTRGVMNGSIPVERLNDMVTRVVATWYQMGQDDETKFPREGPNFSSWTDDEEGLIHFGAGEGERGVVNKYVKVQSDHHKVARQVAAEATVLVKNDGSLPLKRGAWKGKKIGVFGEDAGPGNGANHCKDRACNQGTLASGWGSGAVEFPYLVDPLTALSTSFNLSDNELPEITSILDNYKLNDIIAAAKNQDLCFAFINADAGEGFVSDNGIHGDRNDLYAQKGGDDVVISVAQNCNGPTVVVVHAVGPVLVEKWVELPGVNAILFAHLPGQESGNALADVLFGDVNPSGKLPYTLGKQLEDWGEGGQVLYYPNALSPQQTFKEGVFVDYRWFDKHEIEPRYEFGFGLSYTTFTISSPKITQKQGKTAFPPPRPKTITPPSYSSDLPPISSVLFPPGFTKLRKHIYPYLTSASEITSGPYPYPPSYQTPREPSPAGGDEGGNPALWEDVVELEVTVKNTGDRDGSEVVQVYVGFPQDVRSDSGAEIEFPVKVLRGFEKVLLEAGEEKKVRFGLRRRDLSWWDVEAGNWRLPVEGRFRIWVGSSSRNLPVVVEF
ncbi:hypothetical protein RUND412_008119 [Rhizina undulata]